ncbi:MAG: family 10 glycosylhydrolase [bacterium]
MKLKKPIFFKILLILCNLLFLFSIATAAVLTESRGMWLDENSIPKTESEMSTLVAQFKSANINIIYPETVGKGETTIYPSTLVPWNKTFEPYGDRLKILIKYAHQNGIEVHPWVWVFCVGYYDVKGRTLVQHPEWGALDRDGNLTPGGYNKLYWLCPNKPAVQKYLLDMIKELVTNYDIDGIHLDYIRYEDMYPNKYCFCSDCVNQFKKEYGIDPRDITTKSKYAKSWHRWCEMQVNNFVRDAHREIKNLNPDCMLSAAVGMNLEESRKFRRQDWLHWVNNRYLDFICPMVYTQDVDIVAKWTKDQLTRAGHKTLIYSGLVQWFGATTLRQEIQTARQNKSDGITLFALEQFKTYPEYLAMLKETFPTPAGLPHRNKTYNRAYTKFMTGKSNYVPQTDPPLSPLIKHPVPIPKAEIYFTNQPPKIDGSLDDQCWLSCNTMTPFYIYNTGKKAKVQTQSFATYDRQNLYLAVNCSEPNMDKLKSGKVQRDGPVFEDDSIEVFIDIGNNAADYFHLVVNTLGTQYDTEISQPVWNGTWIAKTHKTNHGYTIELQIPFTDLKTSMPSDKTVWSINFGRSRYTGLKPEYTCWSCTYGTFHTPERFGEIIFTR